MFSSEFYENKWKNLLGDIGPYQISSRKFWNEINKLKSAKQSSSLPNLNIKDRLYKTDNERADLFSGILSETFSDLNHASKSKFDGIFFAQVSHSLKHADFSKGGFIPVSTRELIKAIKKFKINSSPGYDGIQNIFLKKLPFEYVQKVLLRLINLAFCKGIPNDWKIAVITMIPKKNLRSTDPSDYRPISLLSCISKVLERIVKTRLYKFLENFDVIFKQQSGFRNNRGTADNLLFFTQKINENLNKNRKACSIFFDISKAFDKVWHEGLILKLYKLGVDYYILRYIMDFRSNRKFMVKVNNHLSKPSRFNVEFLKARSSGLFFF